MSDPVDPLRTKPAPVPLAPVESDRTEIAPASAPGGAAVPRFGPPVADGEVGTLGPYRVLKELGKGGMGAVYLALDTRLERQLALKVMLPEFAADREAKARFLREARAAANVSHDNVVIVHEADERDGVPYIAMQFLHGCPLDLYLKKRGALPVALVVRVAREVALGLAAAHRLGLVHRDIKPANLWLESPNGRVKVLDFGLAKPIGSASELTKSGEVVGTPPYMSPEQARGLTVDARSDLYSLGAVLYRLCTGRTPFAGEHALAVLAALMTEEPTPVRELNATVPEALAVLIHQLLAKKPEERPQTANDVANRLRGILDQLRAPTVPVMVPTEVTARPEDAFAHLDSGDAPATELEGAPAAPRSEPHGGGKWVLVGAGVAVLLAVVAGAAVVSRMGTNNEPKAKPQEPSTTGGDKGKTDPKGPNAPAPLPATVTNGIGMEFVKVPKGTAWLGGAGGKQGETKVVIERDFYLGKYEVTQEEWEKLMATPPSHFSRNGTGKDAVTDISDADLKRFPVEWVSWDDCQAFIELLNKKEADTGWTYRLPKEVEWEYACRGGPVDKLDSAFDFYLAQPTNTLVPAQANFVNILKRTCKVGSYEPNVLGLHDMHGNLHEWCDDAATIADGTSVRVFRGGSWFHVSEEGRAAYRNMTPPSSRADSLGLRLARVPSVPAGK